MLRKSLYKLGVFVMVMSFVLSACATPGATPAPATQPPAAVTEAPAATQPPAATEAPAATTAPAATEAPAATTAATTAATEAATTAPAAGGAFTPMKLSAPDCSYGGEFKTIEAVDENTVKFTLCNPDPAFPMKVAFSVFAIQNKDYLDKNQGDSVKMSEPTNGTGPYMLKEWVRGDHITFVANPNFWGEKPKASTLIFRWSDQAAQRLLELQSGTVDGIDNPAPEDFDKITADTNLKLYNRDPLTIFYIGFNDKIAPFDKEGVRQAFAMAINRQRIVDQFYPKGSLVAKVFVPPSVKPGFSESQDWYKFDVAAAKKALADAGYPNGLQVTLSFRNVVRGYLPTPDKVAQEIQAELKDIGVTVKINQEESTTFIDNTSAGKEAFYLLGWTGDYPDATNFYDYHFANDNNKQFGDPFPDIVAELKAAAKLSDPAARQPHYDKANELIKQHVPMIPVAHGTSATAFKAGATGAHASPLGNEYFAVVTPPSGDQLVWMQNAEPGALWCSDETDGESLRACEQVYESLLTFKVGGTEVVPALATDYKSSPDATEWTFTLRKGVKFSNGAILNANDVVATFISYWDASSPNHKGRTGTFEYFGAFFGTNLNAKK